MDKIEPLDSLQDIADFLNKNYSIGNPQYLNSIAYEFMNEGIRTICIKLFKLNVHLFPEEANVYDSIAEAYAHYNEYDLALKNYEKTVETARKNSDLSLNSFIANLEQFKKEHYK